MSNLKDTQGNQEWTIHRHRQHWAQETERRRTKQKPQHGPNKTPGSREG